MSRLVLNYNRAIDYLEKFRSENLGLYFSFFFHFLILFSMIGLPNFFGPKEIILPTIIPIEIINVTDVTSIPKESNSEAKLIETKKIKLMVKEKKFIASDNQEIKKIDIKKKPKIEKSTTNQKKISEKNKDIILDKKEEIKIDLEKQKIDIDTNNFESLPTKKIKPKLKPQSNIKKNLDPKKSDIKIETKKEKKIENDPIASLLKDLRNEKISKKVENENKEKNDNSLEKPTEEKPTKDAQLSISEIDLVTQQVSRCFIAPAGAEIKKGMVVRVSVQIRPNRKVYQNSIRIIDTNISKSSPVYGPITESAMRTLLNPDCSPLMLPEDKYQLWKNLTLKFDYSIMRGN